jgi:hypothetical protein
MNSAPKPLLDRLVAFTITLLLVSIGLSWTWQLLHPLLPLFIIATVTIVVFKILKTRKDDW